jgi:hypothetical protein
MKCRILPVITETTRTVTKDLRNNLEVITGKYSIDSVQHRSILGTSKILWKVQLFATGSLSHCDHRFFKGSTRGEGTVTRNDILVAVVVETKCKCDHIKLCNFPPPRREIFNSYLTHFGNLK